MGEEKGCRATHRFCLHSCLNPPVRDCSVSVCAQEGSLRADPIVDVEFEGSMFKVAQLLDKIPLSAVQEAEGGKWALVSDGALYDQLTDAMH